MSDETPDREPGEDAPAASRPPLWRDVRVLRVVAQVLFLAAVVGLGVYLTGNLTSNLRRQGITTSFDFLDQPAGFAIADSSFRSSQSIREAILVGVKNTASVSLVGIVLATIVGVLVGIARLSRNWLVSRAATAYVEAIRNIPVLVVIIFFHFAVTLKLPPIQEANRWLGSIIVSNGGIGVPSFASDGPAGVYGLVLLGGLALGIGLAVWRKRRFDATGEPPHRIAWLFGAFAVVGVAGFFALGRPLALSLPEVERFGITGGVRMTPEYASLMLALALYTATHIAEIVRGSILAVPKGQSEAATALGLKEGARLRLVVLPQALRIMVPPTANQYLNLTKNSSLAVAIGYPEVTRIVFIAIGNGNPAPQSIAVLMVVYLFFSLSISAIMNVVNRRIQLVTR